MKYDQVLDFWFSENVRDKWFTSNEAFDQSISCLFRRCWESACMGELYSWRDTLEGCLAEIIVLDQFSRNLNRNSARAWAQDGMALLLSQEVLRHYEWRSLDNEKQAFLLMPWMHSESRVIHQSAAELFRQINDPRFAEYEHKHREIINRFGRYPHRNQHLGRHSTPEEIAYLNNKNSFTF